MWTLPTPLLRLRCRLLGQSGLRIRLGGKGPVAIDPSRTWGLIIVQNRSCGISHSPFGRKVLVLAIAQGVTLRL